MKRARRAKNWFQDHVRDPYVKQAQADGYRSRAAYKLLAIQETDRIVRPGMRVLDLGAAPGGWSQVLAPLAGKNGSVYAVDILPMQPIKGVHFIQGDICQAEVMAQLTTAMEDQLVDLVVSDMAPNLTGIDSVDQPRSIELANLTLEATQKLLKPGGSLVIKLFQGKGIVEYTKTLEKSFKTVIVRKPKASRAQSREIYLLGKGFTIKHD